MKKIHVIMAFLLGFSLVSFGQSNKGKGPEKTVSLGLKGGINLPRMLYYQNESLIELDQALAITPMGGLFVDIPLGGIIVFAPEAVYVQRGTDMTYEHRSGSTVHYTMSASYADVRLPFELKLPISSYFQPYLVVGAEVGMRLFGQIHMDRTAPIDLDVTIDVGDANLAVVHAGALAGLGVCSKINLGAQEILLKLSVTAHQGLLDSYASGEKDGSIGAQNVNAYQITGWRLPQGLEACLCIGIPLKAHEDDACASFGKDRFRRHGSGRHLFGF
ncbi:MAG: PorT family protein [Bacteroidales bacterium]|nr:PorT family protein [Bacteroidales bacterium]